MSREVVGPPPLESSSEASWGLSDLPGGEEQVGIHNQPILPWWGQGLPFINSLLPVQFSSVQLLSCICLFVILLILLDSTSVIIDIIIFFIIATILTSRSWMWILLGPRQLKHKIARLA